MLSSSSLRRRNGALYANIVVVSSLLIVGSVTKSGARYEAQAESLAVSSLCSKGEKVIFSCPVKRSNKTLSLCASAKLSKTDGYLQYRFGAPGKIELEYPKDRTGSLDAFSYSHYFRAKVDLTEISFSVNGYGYTVFDNYNGEEKPSISEQGVTVTSTNNQKEVTYSCRTRAKVDFGDLPELLKNVSDR